MTRGILDFWSIKSKGLGDPEDRKTLLTSELQPSQLKSHQAVADLNEMDKSV